MQCPSCGSRDIDYHEAGGHSACVKCGTVVEENVIVSSIEFQESGDRSSVVGQFVSATSSKPFSSAVSARGRYGSNADSREATLANARRIITQVASSLRLPNLYVDRAYRLYQLALQRNFLMGRRVIHVVATCLYTICRQEKSPHLLIDFSDALQINVYILGKAFLQFSRSLNLKLPIVDPSLYIHRFAARLDLGDKMGGVITTALRIVTRLKKDWISTGRRPDGICAVAILIASRCHGYHKTQAEVSKLFRISSRTLFDRLADFRATPSAQLTVEQFHMHDFDAEYDPPAFRRSAATKEGGTNSCDTDDDSDESENENKDGVMTIDGVRVRKVIIKGVEVNVPIAQTKKKRRLTEFRIQKSLARKALYDNIYADICGAATEESAEALRKEIDLVAKSGVEVGGWGSNKPYLVEEAATIWDISTGGAAIAASTAAAAAASLSGNPIGSTYTVAAPSATSSSSSSSSSGVSKLPSRIYRDGEEYPEEEIYVEPEKKIKTITERPEIVPEVAVDEEELAAAQEEVMSVNVNGCMLDEEESKKRSAIWEQNFRPFMDERARRRKVREDNDLMRGAAGGKGRKKHTKSAGPRDSASQAVFDGVNTKKASKKINYDALQGAFGGDGSFKLPAPVVVDPSLNVYSSGSSRNQKPLIDSKVASTAFPFAPFGSTTASSMRLPPQGIEKKPVAETGIAGRKTFLLSESQPKGSAISTSKAETAPVPSTDKKVDVNLKPAAAEEDRGDGAAMDDDDMLMYDEGGDNEDDYDDDEEY